MSDLKDASSRAEAFRFTLRRETRGRHEALDAHPAFHALLAGTLDRSGYIRLMQLFHAFYAGIDRDLSNACRGFALDRLGFDYQPRAPMLAADLATLGAAPALRAAAPRHSALLLDSPASLGGALYVLEGSMLGGAALHGSTEALLGRTGAGNTYWRWCREKGGERWAMTCRMLEDLATTEVARSRMVASAAAAFDAFAAGIADWAKDRIDRSSGRC